MPSAVSFKLSTSLATVVVLCEVELQCVQQSDWNFLLNKLYNVQEEAGTVEGIRGSLSSDDNILNLFVAKESRLP